MSGFVSKEVAWVIGRVSETLKVNYQHESSITSTGHRFRNRRLGRHAFVEVSI